MDELNRMDRVLNTPLQRLWSRRAAYKEFRDRTEPLERIGNTKPRKRVRPIIILPGHPKDEAGA